MFDIFIMNLGGHDNNVAQLQDRFAHATVVRYYDTHLDTIRRCVTRARTEYIWVIASCCDYSNFDFEYCAAPWEAYQIHCWASDEQQFGDTFLINVAEFKKQQDIAMLEWYKDVNWHSDSVSRLPVPVVEYHTDNLTETIKNYEFTTPYVVFANREFGDDYISDDCLWTERQRAVRSVSTSNGISVVPRDVKKYLKTQIYDYPYLLRNMDNKESYMDNALDVVYISNGEPEAEYWYNHLQRILYKPNGKANSRKFDNRLHRVQNVNGRVAAYQAAARVSTTPWFFAVFAKLEVNEKFDFNWQPDYWQQPKHYIFNATNTVNGLEYGHMGMIAYNKQLVLDNNNPGIDFTLSQPHESVPVLSGTAHFDQDAWTTWRTAFREVLKLRMFMETSPTLETEHRLNVWQNFAAGKFAEHSKQGARDAIAYYEEVNGEAAKLQLSFDWAWLRERYNHLTK